ncbi:MAG: class I SAM-dependent methyltransferase [Candidatus Acidiferrales bacterium]|jgi:predicted O-methyltransferase YrrM
MATPDAPIKNPCTFTTPKVRAVLDRLYGNAKVIDEPALAVANPVTDAIDGDEKYRLRSEMLSEAYLPVPRGVGRLLYILARNHACETIVEFGTSLAISTIYLAAAVRDNGRGTVITTELHAEKGRRAGENLRDAGLLDLVEICVGDARETLQRIDRPVDFLFIDGWKELYLPVLKIVEPRLWATALVVADNISLGPTVLKPFADYVSAAENGYVSVELPIGDRVSVSLRLTNP